MSFNIVGGKKMRDEYPLRLVGTEEACVMAFLHHDICDSWLIVFLQFNAGVSDGQELVVENLHKEIACFSKKKKKCWHNSTR